MKLDLSDDERKLLITALEHYIAYLKAVARSNANYDKLLERIKKLP